MVKLYEMFVENNCLVLKRQELPRNINNAPKYAPNTYVGAANVFEFISDSYLVNTKDNLNKVKELIDTFRKTNEIGMEVFNFYFSMMFAFRHYVELQLKAFISDNIILKNQKEAIGHNLTSLLKIVSPYLSDCMAKEIENIVFFIEKGEYNFVEYYRYLSDKDFNEISNRYTIDLDIYEIMNKFLDIMKVFDDLRQNYNRLLSVIKINDLNTKNTLVKCLQKKYQTLDLYAVNYIYVDSQSGIDKILGSITLNKEILTKDEKSILDEFSCYYQKLKDIFDERSKYNALKNGILCEIYKNYNNSPIDKDAISKEYNISESQLDSILNELCNIASISGKHYLKQLDCCTYRVLQEELCKNLLKYKEAKRGE